MYPRLALTTASLGWSAYNVVNGGRKMYEGGKNHDGDKIFGGGMQVYQGFTGPMVSGGSLAARAIHGATTSAARYMSRNERHELRQNITRVASYVPPSIFK